MTTFNVKDENSLMDLNKHLSSNLFIGGHQPNNQDAFTFEAFQGKAPNITKYPAICGWFYLVHYFAPLRESWKTLSEEKNEKILKPKKEEKKDEKKENKKDSKKENVPTQNNDLDLGIDVEEDPEAVKARQARMQAALEKKKQKDKEKESKGIKKEQVIAKSLILLDIKVFEADQDLKKLYEKIKEINMEGLEWKQDYKTPVIAFGIKKLVMGLVVEDEKVSVEDVIEKIEALEDEVQSVDIACFNKI